MSEPGGPWPTDPWSGGAQQQNQAAPPGQWPYPGMPGPGVSSAYSGYYEPPFGSAPGTAPDGNRPYEGYPPPPPPYGYAPGQESGPYGSPYGTQSPYGAMPYAYGYPAASSTSGMAIAAMVCGICGFLCYVPGLVGIVLGIIALNDVNRTGRRGKGMAVAGIVCGAAWIVLGIVGFLTSAFSPV